MINGLADYLRAKPEDFVIEWYTDSMNSTKPWDNAWVDVMFEDHLAWVITSGLLEDDDDDFRWPPDMAALVLVDPDRAQGDTLAGIKPVPIHTPAAEEDFEEVRWAQHQVGPNAYWLGAPCWSAPEINRAIEDWCIREVGRPVQARWDADHGPSPFMQRAADLMQAMQDGIEPTYLVRAGEADGGEGLSVRVTDSVMDMLVREMTENDG